MGLAYRDRKPAIHFLFTNGVLPRTKRRERLKHHVRVLAGFGDNADDQPDAFVSGLIISLNTKGGCWGAGVKPFCLGLS